VTKLRVGELAIELGPAALPALTAEEQRKIDVAERRAAKRRELDETWAHTGGLGELSDEDIDKLIARGASW
jgi:hypothetical protein